MAWKLRVNLAEDGADAERLDQLAGYLRAELLELDVENVTRLPGAELPPGTRAAVSTVIGGLLVTVSQTADNVVQVITTIRDWLRRGNSAGRSVRIELDGDVLELPGASDEQVERLVELFISRHAQGDGPCPASAKP